MGYTLDGAMIGRPGKLVDTGHFALATHTGEISPEMCNFLDQRGLQRLLIWNGVA